MSHLKQALFRVSKAGNDLATQTTGDDLSDLAKAILLRNFIHEVKEAVVYACDDLEVSEETFVYLKCAINDIDESGELAEVIENLEEATNEPEDPNEHSTMNGIGTGCKRYVN